MATDKKVYNDKTKWIISLMSGLLFLIIASPITYNLVNMATSTVGLKISDDGCPNIYGLILHSIDFVLIVRVMMR